MNLKLTIAYDGTSYLGWQKTTMGPSIEETLERVLEKLLQHPVVLQAASRTDAGVHAKGQIVNFFTSANWTVEQLKFSANTLLPKDVSISSIEKVKNEFHPTLDCLSKEYHYQVNYGKVQIPQDRLYFWHYPYGLNILNIKKAIPLLIGEQDFSAFCNTKKKTTYSHYKRKIEKIDIIELCDQRIRFEITGNSFLYKMVRNIIGTLVYVGAGKIAVESIPTILKNGDRTQAGMTAPSHGLFLYQVNYN